MSDRFQKYIELKYIRNNNTEKVRWIYGIKAF